MNPSSICFKANVSVHIIHWYLSICSGHISVFKAPLFCNLGRIAFTLDKIVVGKK